MTTASNDSWDEDFDDRLDAIALPAGRNVERNASTSLAYISLILLAVGLALGVTFFVAGLLLFVFCIGLLVWYAGAAILVVVHGIGAIVGLAAVASAQRRPNELTLGLVGFLLNSAIVGVCVWFLWVCLRR